MARFCELTGKGPMTGNKVSHSNIKTKRKFNPNLQKKKLFVPELDRWIEVKLSTQALRTINKKGIYPYLKELEKKGEIVLDL
ncbi:MAG: 50S ribosomal protein L28 [Chitinophagales bacterium]|nr:50S ribosomal protein L28 [Chitinophagales bacterium]